MTVPAQFKGARGRLAKILPLLACPLCREALALNASGASIECTGCGASYPVRDGIPVLLPQSVQEPGIGWADADDPVSRHPYSPQALDIIAEHAGGWVLDLGAGGKLQQLEHVVQVDIFRYPMTDVVATADCLPFRDNAFQAVISQAVFEHLQYPEEAADEIRRVLQPQGVLRIDTAFLQPEHGYPYHFFNATETGLRHWFRQFDIEWSGVAPYQHPKWALSWFLSVYLDRLDGPSADVVRQAGMGQVQAALDALAAGKPRPGDEGLLQALDALPVHELRTLAAGVSIHGRNPPKPAETACPLAIGAQKQHAVIASHHTEEALRQQVALLQQQTLALRQEQTLARDRGNYLAQMAYFHVDVRLLQTLTVRARLYFAAASLVRLLLPPSWWLAWRARVRRQRFSVPPLEHTQAERPFFSVVVAPEEVESLIRSFFSLTHQSYTGWELLVIERPGQPVAVRNVLQDFIALDSRVRSLRVTEEQAAQWMPHAHVASQGNYVLGLPSGVALAEEALQTIYTLLRARPETDAVIADFEYRLANESRFLQCCCRPIEGHGFEADPKVLSCVVHARQPENGHQGSMAPVVAYIPEVLFRQVRFDLVE
ncbi:Methyltransferase domain-containing protein [Oryzisolibacter propanilivorax]|uniref:Methyltransferase domain-containing protein n=1 Tax=Oryzisolibacter propanilivorax TaxID=1527607 RepID=A0A1G9S4R0_9BURK|nr:Methyltransferase domain-containing protein [Oryzisolibacter propanilivorax]